MITNLDDLDAAISWLRGNDFEPDRVDELQGYRFKVIYAGFPIVAATAHTEYRIYCLSPSNPPPHNMLYHLQVAPWVVDEIRRKARTTP